MSALEEKGGAAEERVVALGLVEEKEKCEGLTRVVTSDNNLTGENRTGKETTGCISK